MCLNLDIKYFETDKHLVLDILGSYDLISTL